MSISIKASNWETEKEFWTHLSGVPFPKLERRKEVDILIGADYLYLQQSLAEIVGKIGEPIARLTLLGWTCVGQAINVTKDGIRTNMLQSFFTKKENLETIVERFWEMEEIDKKKDNVSPEDQILIEVMK